MGETSSYMSKELIMEKAQYWADSAVFDEKTRSEIKNLIAQDASDDLTDRFYKELEFGTGGMRGIMGAGSARMNIYNIRKATTALAMHIQAAFSNGPFSVAISYDCRINSQLFAKAAAEVLAAHGIKSFITSQMRPTPMLSYMVRYFKCHAGICVTASHNPSAYNGYKVYWNHGGQLTPPHDEAIVNLYNKISDYSSLTFMPYQEALQKGLACEVLEELDQAYFTSIKELSFHPNKDKSFKVVYSPIHGTGIYAVPAALKLFGVENVSIVKEQEVPDGNFPTVKSPNPEDFEALSMALALAEKEQADLVLATDPDSDRIAVVVRENGKLTAFNGNQLGCLLNEYVLSSSKRLNRLPKNPLVIKTVVTTDLQRDIAEHYGAFCDETLTGFKWICDKIESYETGKLTPYRQFVCGGEESYGFLAGSFVRDKDAIIACGLAAEMTSYYKSLGKNLSDVLDDLYKRHGVYEERLKTFTFPGKKGADTILQMMQNLRQNPPKQIAGLWVEQMVDLEKKLCLTFNKGELAQKAPHPLPKSDVLQFILEGGSKVSIRPSGTEPKIKIYTSYRDGEKDLSGSRLEERKELAKEMALKLESYFLNI